MNKIIVWQRFYVPTVHVCAPTVTTLVDYIPYLGDNILLHVWHDEPFEYMYYATPLSCPEMSKALCI